MSELCASAVAIKSHYQSNTKNMIHMILFFIGGTTAASCETILQNVIFMSADLCNHPHQSLNLHSHKNSVYHEMKVNVVISNVFHGWNAALQIFVFLKYLLRYNETSAQLKAQKASVLKRHLKQHLHTVHFSLMGTMCHRSLMTHNKPWKQKPTKTVFPVKLNCK